MHSRSPRIEALRLTIEVNGDLSWVPRDCKDRLGEASECPTLWQPRLELENDLFRQRCAIVAGRTQTARQIGRCPRWSDRDEVIV